MGYFSDLDPIWTKSLDHSDVSLPENVTNQFEIRLRSFKPLIEKIELHAVAGRGGPLEPLSGGTYRINDKMLETYRSGKFANHASNLGAILADSIARKRNIPAFIVDPVSTDEFMDVARVSGVPGISRKSRSHALNIKFCYQKACQDLGEKGGNHIVAHLGGGISIAAVKNGKIIDVNDALLGMGPFSVNRAGAIPLSGMMELVFNERLSEEELKSLLSTRSGFKGYLGTADFRKIEKKVAGGDKQAKLIYRAFVYQVVKEIGALYATFNGNVRSLILTGGLSESKMLVKDIANFIVFLDKIFVYPGSFELEALASGTLNVLNGTLKEKIY